MQPSLFEGWSTVIEDAKHISQYVLASRIPPNLEQADANMEFFEPQNFIELADLMRKYVDHDPPRIDIDYRPRQHAFARAFLEILRSVSGEKGASQ